MKIYEWKREQLFSSSVAQIFAVFFTVVSFIIMPLIDFWDSLEEKQHKRENCVSTLNSPLEENGLLAFSICLRILLSLHMLY